MTPHPTGAGHVAKRFLGTWLVVCSFSFLIPSLSPCGVGTVLTPCHRWGKGGLAQPRGGGPGLDHGLLPPAALQPSRVPREQGGRRGSRPCIRRCAGWPLMRAEQALPEPGPQADREQACAQGWAMCPQVDAALPAAAAPGRLRPGGPVR